MIGLGKKEGAKKGGEQKRGGMYGGMGKENPKCMNGDLIFFSSFSVFGKCYIAKKKKKWVKTGERIRKGKK